MKIIIRSSCRDDISTPSTSRRIRDLLLLKLKLLFTQGGLTLEALEKMMRGQHLLQRNGTRRPHTVRPSKMSNPTAVAKSNALAGNHEISPFLRRKRITAYRGVQIMHEGEQTSVCSPHISASGKVHHFLVIYCARPPAGRVLENDATEHAVLSRNDAQP